MAAKSKSEQSFFAADVIRRTDTLKRLEFALRLPDTG
jgi:hypothetical protein